MYKGQTYESFKTHVILLDNRYSFNKKENDRLGAQQVEWLSKTLENQSDSNVTIIMAGV